MMTEQVNLASWLVDHTTDAALHEIAVQRSKTFEGQSRPQADDMQSRLLAKNKELEDDRLLPKSISELRLLICSADRKYDQLRSELMRSRDPTSAHIVSKIALILAPELNMNAKTAAPLVASGLLAFLQMGKEAFCFA
jgi:hypothetical protein